MSLVVCNNCVQYYGTDLHCTSAHTLCSYVQLYSSLSLETSETQLELLFSRVDLEVKNGSLTQSCFEAFSLLYCHQVYTPCSPVLNSSFPSTLSAPSDADMLCESECMDAIAECESDWGFLADLVNTLVVPDLPPLLTNCSSDGSASAEYECIPLLAGKICSNTAV